MRILVHPPVVRKPGLLVLFVLATSLVLIVHHFYRAAFEQKRSSEHLTAKKLTHDTSWPPPGHMGQPFTLPADIVRILPDVQEQLEHGWQGQGYNQLASDLISVHRQLPDLRDPWCLRHGVTHPHLPPVSIVIVFHDEALSTLLRTVHSVLNRSPPELVQEIVLVDDWSSSVPLKTFLEDYFLPYGDKVRILRTPARYGLIRARIYGARRTSADYLLFLDAHCECLPGWLEPLLAVVLTGPGHVAVPTIDWLNETTLALQAGPSNGLYGAFDWNLSFQWRSRYDRILRSGSSPQHENALEPFDSPIMAGGLFCIAKEFFARLGWYDPGLEVYGGENMELSFKVWMCGGAIKIVPCSRVGHIQKRNHPYIGNYHRERELTMKNTLRVAEVWLDEYADFLYRLHPDYRLLLASTSNDSLADRHRLREQLSCRSFRWYMREVFPEQDDPGGARSMGWLRSDQQRCLTWPMRDRSLATLACHGLGGQQIWFFYEATGRVTREGHCLQVGADSATVTMELCAFPDGDGVSRMQAWHRRKQTGQLVHKATGRCLVSTADRFRPTVEPCALPEVLVRNATGQKWTFQIEEI
uniref:Polypeptide N-acetylgalactosaminyltransferase n=1 Tax=Anopheles atroparvus TaxID=41427 RepID=A0A182J581_ANOAO